MKFRKFASWSPTKKHRERRQAEKEKNKQANVSATVLRNSSEQSTKLSMIEKKGKKVTKGDVVISTTATDTGVLSKIDADRPTSFLFEDNEEDDINGNNPINNKNTAVLDESKVNHPQIITRLETTATPLTPNAYLDAAPLKKNLFKMPQEIMIDPFTVPPSPMREPNVNVMSSPGMNRRLLDDYHPGMFLNFQDQSSPRETAGLHQPQHCFGDPVGDIAMQRQLMDAQRLVRIILGKPLHKDHQQVLGANSILQAIRSYALMKAELMDLRKKQELADGDPPAILLALGSPAATTPSTTRTGMGSPRRPGVQQTAVNTNINASDSICGSTNEFRSDADLDAQPTTSTLEHANETIERLQKDLTTANDIILELQDKMEGVEKDCRKRNTTNEVLVGESSENQKLQMKNEMRQSQEESERRIQEMENKLKLQHQEHEKQIQAIVMEKEQIVDTTKTEKNENTILIELSHNTTSNTSGHLASSIRKPMVDNAIKVTTEES